MKNWLAYFFGSFFLHGQARQGDRHNLLNTLLALGLAFAIILGALSLGNTIYFNKAFSQDEQFKEFLQESFVDGVIDLTIKDGKAIGSKVINTFDNTEDKQYAVNGYNLVLDLRNLDTTFTQFTVVAISGEKTISYKDYTNLDESSRQSYNLKATYTNQPVDIITNAETYKTYLTNITNQEDIKTEYESLNATTETYYNDLYSLYIKSIYYNIDVTLGKTIAPTLQDYYLQFYSTGKTDKYLILLNNQCFCSFGENKTSFIGSYKNLEGFTVSDGGEKFIEKAFHANSGSHTTMYAINLMQAMSVGLIIWLVLAAVFYLIAKGKKLVCGCSFTSCLQIVGSFIFISAVIATIACLIASMYMTSAMLFYTTTLIFAGILILRTIIFIICEFAIPNEDKYIE